jgi:dethiobiotin synthetase
VSPHLAARLAGRPIELEAALAPVTSEPKSTRWVVEGAGGLLVPINDTTNMADLVSRLGLPAVIVARTALGTINHTLLTIEALRRRSIHAAGVIMVGVPNADNRDAIERYGRVDVLGVMPGLDPLTPVSLAQWASAELDPDGRLARLLQ